MKTYEAPKIVACGDAVRDTKSTIGGSEEPVGQAPMAGSVGFNL
ncbi:MAG: hypothetical protein ACRETY_11260 [Steroidobacteraceae bacterium]